MRVPPAVQAWAAGSKQTTPGQVCGRVCAFETATLRTATTRTTGPGTHDTHKAASTQMTDHTPRLTPVTHHYGLRGPDDITTNSKHSCSRTQVRTHGSPAQHQSPGNASAVRFGTSGTQSRIPLVLPAAVLRTLVELEVAIASVYNSLGFEWVNPVLSLFEDWVLGLVLQTGLLFFSLFKTGVCMGVEGRLLPAPRSLSNGI